MNLLLGLTDSKDKTIIQAILLLKNRGIYINGVNYIRTRGNEIDEYAQLFFLNHKIGYYTRNISNNGLLKNENDYIL